MNAIEVRKRFCDCHHPDCRICNICNEYEREISELRQAIEQLEKVEPVAWKFDRATFHEGDLRGRQWVNGLYSQHKPRDVGGAMIRNLTPIYTHPAPLRELTEEDAKALVLSVCSELNPNSVSPLNPQGDYFTVTPEEMYAILAKARGE